MTAILEIRDGMAVGPIHLPVERKRLGNGNLFIKFDADAAHLSWPTLCGTDGYVYDRDGLLSFQDGLKDCFECKVAQLSPPRKKRTHRPEDPAELRARHDRHRGTCGSCGGPTSWPGRNRQPKLCLACYRRENAARHGSRTMYARGCRCAACVKVQSDYNREYRRKKAAA